MWSRGDVRSSATEFDQQPQSRCCGQPFPACTRRRRSVGQPAHAQNLCAVLGGGLVECAAPLPPVIGTPPAAGTVDLTGVTDPLTVTLADGFVSNGPLNLGTLAGADINIVSNGLTTLSNSGSGLVANSGGAINAGIGNVTTGTEGATGLLLNAADALVFTSDGTISGEQCRCRPQPGSDRGTQRGWRRAFLH
jgi:hypothetical protein